ncbi:MAG: ABC transporter substrate-binding protein [Motiliproteus sp.]
MVQSKRTIRRSGPLLWVLWLSFGLSSHVHSAGTNADAVISQTMEQVVLLLADQSLRQPAEFQRLLAGVDQALAPVVNFDRISRGVMGKYFRRASADQHQRFQTAFKRTLIKTYGKALAVFEISEFKLRPNSAPSARENRELVRVDVLDQSGKSYQLDYFMARGEQGWKLVNVRLDGINLGQLFRQQFSEALENHGGDIDQVIDQWTAMSEPSQDNKA